MPGKHCDCFVPLLRKWVQERIKANEEEKEFQGLGEDGRHASTRVLVYKDIWDKIYELEEKAHGN